GRQLHARVRPNRHNSSLETVESGTRLVRESVKELRAIGGRTKARSASATPRSGDSWKAVRASAIPSTATAMTKTAAIRRLVWSGAGEGGIIWVLVFGQIGRASCRDRGGHKEDRACLNHVDGRARRLQALVAPNRHSDTFT